MLKYIYDADVSAVPDTEICVYTLRESEEVQQAVSLFQAKYPDYYVTLEVGLTDDDAVTASDALRTLNTEIMAGNGPDVLILDGMPMDSYAEKGLLADLSGLYGELAESGELLENIAGAYRTEDGSVYAIPSRFRVPLLLAGPETLAGIESLTDLADTAAALLNEDAEAENVLSLSNIYGFLYTYYSACSVNFMESSKSLNETAVREFLEQMKKLFEKNTERLDEEEKAEFAGYEKEYDEDTYYTSAGFVDYIQWAEGVVKLAVLNLGDGSAWAELCNLCEKTGAAYETSPFSGGTAFEPRDIVGISSRSSEPEGAEAFVKFLLSQEAQESGQGNGFPVNRSAFEKELFADKQEGEELYTAGAGWTDDDGTELQFTYSVTVPAAQERQDFTALVETLTTPASTDTVMRDLILENAGKYVAGEIKLTEALDAICQKMELYLAE